MKARYLILILMAVLSYNTLMAQIITDSGYRTVGYIKSDGTIQDSSYRTIGHAKNIPMEWAALYFSLENDNTKCL